MGLNSTVTNQELVNAYLDFGFNFSPTLTREAIYDALVARVIEQPEISDVSAGTLTTLYKLGFFIVDESANLYQL